MVSLTSAQLSIQADPAQMRRASVWMEQTGLELGVPAEHLGRLDLCLNEALANVIEHGGAGARESAVVLHFDLNRNADQSFAASVTVADSGKPVNPLLLLPKKAAHSLDEATPGGLGIQMIRMLSDKQDYEFVGGQNRLTFTVCWHPESA